jgi:hypothetical protein
MVDITIGAIRPITGRARTPKEIASANNGSSSGSPALMPSRIECCGDGSRAIDGTYPPPFDLRRRLPETVPSFAA